VVLVSLAKALVALAALRGRPTHAMLKVALEALVAAMLVPAQPDLLAVAGKVVPLIVILLEVGSVLSGQVALVAPHHSHQRV
jgi:hypothetical protein